MYVWENRMSTKYLYFIWPVKRIKLFFFLALERQIIKNVEESRFKCDFAFVCLCEKIKFNLILDFLNVMMYKYSML